MDILNPDILKFITILVALFYFNLKVKPHVSPVNTRLINLGLALILFSSFLDYVDGVKALSNISLLNRENIVHDVLEDQVGDTCGIALFILGTFREIFGKGKE